MSLTNTYHEWPVESHFKPACPTFGKLPLCDTLFMTLYTPIDDALRQWAGRNGIHIATEYKDCEVRSFELATQFGSVQIGIEPRSHGGFDAVGCNNRLGEARRLERVNIQQPDVGPALDELLASVRRWKW